MQAITFRPASAGSLTRGKAVRNRRTTAIPIVRAAQGDAQKRQEQKDSNNVVLSAISAVAAATLALTGPASAADLPTFANVATHKVQIVTPDLSAGKDDELVGKAFEKAGVPGNAPKAADALRSKVPGLKQQGDKTGQEERSLSQKAVNAVPDLSAGKDDELVGKAFEKAGVPGNAPKAADALRSKVPGLKQQGDKTGQEERTLSQKALNAVPDLSAGKDDELVGKAFEKAGVPGNAPKAADALRSKVPGLKQQGDKTGQEERNLSQKAVNAVPDLSAGKDDELVGKAFEKAGVPGNAPKAADAIRSKVPGLQQQGDKTGQEERTLSQKAVNAVPDLSAGKDDELVGQAFEKAGVPGNAPKAADALRSKVPGLQQQGDKTGQEEQALSQKVKNIAK